MLCRLPITPRRWRMAATRALSLLLPCLLLLIEVPAAAADTNLWRDTHGQVWFYEVRSSGGEPMAGTWWDGGLEPRTTYTISFEVTRINGTVAVHLGNRDQAIRITRPGRYSYDFWVPQSGGRKLMFTAAEKPADDGKPIVAAVRRINVQRKGNRGAEAPQSPEPEHSPPPATTTGPSGPGAASPKGHYWFFSRERDLEQEVVAYQEGTAERTGSFYVSVANNIHSALTTEGVVGFGMHFKWRTLETADGRYDWRLVDANMRAAEHYGLKLVVKVVDRSFNGADVLPRYWPKRYRLWTEGNGKRGYVSRRWDPYVYNRKIRLHKAIINRYRNNPAFGGIASTETAMGRIDEDDYSIAAYQNALEKIAVETQAAMPPGLKYHFYLNFLQGGVSRDMRKDSRIALARRLGSNNLTIGAPDITPDVRGMPGSLNSARVHLKRTRPDLGQFCHLQHVDQGLGNRNFKDNSERRAFMEFIRENRSWAQQSGALYVTDEVKDRNGNKAPLHPSSELGRKWQPDELFEYGQRNFDCDWMFWHYRENVHNRSGQFWWQDIQPVILNNRYFNQ